MVGPRTALELPLAIFLLCATPALAQQPVGSIRGVVYDRDFNAPLGAAQVTIVETGAKTSTGDQGNYVLGDIPTGKYTLVFSKDGYVRQIRSDVVVSAGQLSDVDVYLSGDFTDMEEFVVQDALQLNAGSEAALLNLRFESASLLDSISSDLMSRAGASDAASALRLVAGASVKDGKSAVIRGLPDRYVSSQMNSVVLPTSDEDKRAVELDQFPAAVIQSIQVSKTFTPDQQGNASGGAVNVVLKGIPSEPLFFQFKSQVSYNSQVGDGNDFRSYGGGGVNFWGEDDGERSIPYDLIGESWEGSVGTSTRSAPTDYKWSLAGGGMHEFEGGLKFGGFASFFYERDSSFDDDAIDDSWWVTDSGSPMTPEQKQLQGSDDFKTALFDVTQGSELVQWGFLTTAGVEFEQQSVDFTYFYTHTTEDTATLATDTRGKQFFFPGYDPLDPTTPGHEDPDAAPYLRLETLEYTRRSTDTLQLNGRHTIPTGDWGPFREPEIDWVVAWSSAHLDQPDKRQFGAQWVPGREPIPGFVIPPVWTAYKPAANFTLGNLQRIWKTVKEDSDQYSINLKLPFEQWSGDEGYFAFGIFHDKVDREYTQETFSNFNDNSSFEGAWDQPWSGAFPYEDHPITESLYDVDYDGEQKIGAWYAMADLPLVTGLNVIGGARFESTKISTVNHPEELATWFPPGSTAPVELQPGDADVDLDEDEVLPSLALVYQPFDELTLRGSFAQTLARPTFKELSPILQQEFLGGPIFIGNPDLGLSKLKNYDLRVDYTPFPGGLISGSYFYKDIEDPIEYVQRVQPFSYTTAVNYPEGQLSGFEFEVRQEMGQIWEPLEGLSLGANATFINSEVTLPNDEQEQFALLGTPIKHRDMTNAPEHLYNFFVTYDLAATGTQITLFYTVQGDTLVEGAGEAGGNFVPSVYATQFGTLNLTLAQKLGESFKLNFQAKNLTNPDIETVYRSKYIGEDVLKTSVSGGIDWSVSLSANFTF